MLKDRICVNVDQGFKFYDEVLAITEELGVTDQILIKSSKTVKVVAELEVRHRHNLIDMPIVNIQKPAGVELLNMYLEQDVAPLAYEVCWQSNDGTFKDVCRKIISQGSRV